MSFEADVKESAILFLMKRDNKSREYIERNLVFDKDMGGDRESLEWFYNFLKKKEDNKVQELKEEFCLVSGFDKKTNTVSLCDSIYLFLNKKQSEAFEDYKNNNLKLKFKKDNCVNCKKFDKVFG